MGRTPFQGRGPISRKCAARPGRFRAFFQGGRANLPRLGGPDEPALEVSPPIDGLGSGSDSMGHGFVLLAMFVAMAAALGLEALERG